MIERVLGTLIPVPPIPSQIDDHRDIRSDHRRATHFVRYTFRCKILQGYYGTGLPSLITSHAFAASDNKKVIRHLWVIVGDCPGAMFDLAYADNPIDAIQHYADKCDEWVRAIRAARHSFDPEIFPDGMTPRPDLAEMLSSRLDFIRDKLLPELRARDDWGRVWLDR
jgi:hypothetical protein